MPSFNGIAYVPRQGKCQEVIRDRILELGYEERINSIIPSGMGHPITETKKQALYFAYKDLPILAETLKFNGILDIYETAGFKTPIPGDFQNLEKICQPYSDDKLDKIIAMIDNGNFGNVWWTDLKSPTDKMRAMFKRFLTKQLRLISLDFGDATAEVLRAYAHPYNAPSMDALPEIALKFDVSLRWMLGLEPEGHLYSHRTVVEELYDKYKLISPANRKIIEKMLEGGKCNEP